MAVGPPPNQSNRPPGNAAFRRQLAEALAHWQAAGWIDSPSAQRLASAYHLEEPALHWALIAAYGIGALLIGGGVISLVAYNWEVLPDAVKLGLTGLALVLAHWFGDRLRQVGNHPHLARGLLFLGSLLMGANIGVAAQIFNVSSANGGGFALWGAGAWLAAWLYREAATAALAGICAALWAGEFIDDHGDYGPWIALGYAAAFLPLAWRDPSRILFAGLLVLCTIVYGVALGELGHEHVLLPYSLGVVAVLGVWSTAQIFKDSHGYKAVGRWLALPAFVLCAYVVSFASSLGSGSAWQGSDTLLVALLLPWLIALSGAIWTLVVHRQRWREDPLVAAMCVGAFVLAGADLSPDREDVVPVVANLVLAGFAALSVIHSVHHRDRALFWLGTSLAAILVLTRFFELESELWLKGLGFIACGASLVAVGVWFERQLKRERGTT